MQLRKPAVIAVLTFATSGIGGAQILPPAIGSREVNLYARLLAMTDTRQLDTSLVDRALAASWRPLRAAATLAIGQVGQERGAARLLQLRVLLRDHDTTVAANAAYALGLLRDTASISDLTAALALDREVAREAAWALGEIGAPARPAISAAL